MSYRDIDRLDQAITDQIYENEFHNTSNRIKSGTDIRRIVNKYKSELLKNMKDTPEEERILEVLGVPLYAGFNLLYGPPDTCKTTIAIGIANECARNGMRVAYLDAENKIQRDEISSEVIYIGGSNNAATGLKKLITLGMVDLAIVDTICTLSKVENFMRSCIKYLRPLGIYSLLVNQTRYFRHGSYPAGPDCIMHDSINQYRIVSKRRVGNKIVVVTDTGIRIVFDSSEDEGLVYNRSESVLMEMLAEASILRTGRRKYTYEGTEYTKGEILELIEQRSGRCPSGTPQIPVQPPSN